MFNKKKIVKACIIIQKDTNGYLLKVIPYQQKMFTKSTSPDAMMANKYESIKSAVDEALKIKDNFESQMKVETRIIID